MGHDLNIFICFNHICSQEACIETDMCNTKEVSSAYRYNTKPKMIHEK